MNFRKPSKLEVMLAKVCRHCPVCSRARTRQQGVALWLTATVERRLCPFCRAYARVYGRPASISGASMELSERLSKRLFPAVI